MKQRGRPTKSEIRQNIIELLSSLGKAYGYQIHKEYNKVFPPCTRESIYYHLKKGLLLGEFTLAEVKQEKGQFSWGGIVEKRYYQVGENAEVKGDSRVVNHCLKVAPKDLMESIL